MFKSKKIRIALLLAVMLLATVGVAYASYWWYGDASQCGVVVEFDADCRTDSTWPNTAWVEFRMTNRGENGGQVAWVRIWNDLEDEWIYMKRTDDDAYSEYLDPEEGASWYFESNGEYYFTDIQAHISYYCIEATGWVTVWKWVCPPPPGGACYWDLVHHEHYEEHEPW